MKSKIVLFLMIIDIILVANLAHIAGRAISEGEKNCNFTQFTGAGVAFILCLSIIGCIVFLILKKQDRIT